MPGLYGADTRIATHFCRSSSQASTPAICHSREGRDPLFIKSRRRQSRRHIIVQWIPAFAGMTDGRFSREHTSCWQNSKHYSYSDQLPLTHVTNSVASILCQHWSVIGVWVLPGPKYIRSLSNVSQSAGLSHLARVQRAGFIISQSVRLVFGRNPSLHTSISSPEF